MMKLLLQLLTAISLCLLCTYSSFSQTSCFTKDEVNQLLVRFKSEQNVVLNTKLKDELVKLQQKRRSILQESLASGSPEKLTKRMDEVGVKNTTRLCQIIQQFGWPSKELVGREGVTATVFLLQSSDSVQLPRDLFPLVVESVKRGDLGRSAFADYFDRVRVRLGLKQLFGTQATVSNGLLVIEPIEAEAHVDDRRKQFGLPPLDYYIKYLENSYHMPVVRLPLAFGDASVNTEDSEALSAKAAGISEETEDQVIRIDTKLVNLNVAVFNNTLKSFVSTLGKDDFAVFEDGRQEAITFFEATTEPFDLVLLIDLSGSTSGKRDLIRKSTQRFIEAVRPFDRVAILTFSDDVRIVAPMTDDRASLLKSVKNIEGMGGSHVWDALKLTLDRIVGPKSMGRRKAIVFMTDGIDNALQFVGGSSNSFTDLLETIRRDDTLIIPIYLETQNDFWPKSVYQSARSTMELIARESGGLFYQAKKLEDLNGVYEQVINDLGKVYSLGYRPTNQRTDKSWRSVKVQILNHPELATHTRPGYYPN